MIIEVLDKKGAKVSQLELDDAVYGAPVKEHLFYEVVRMQMANRRSGTASTKTKGEVSGGGAKPWKQKGTGRARSGSNRSPLWRHGGTCFGPRPRDYSYKVPRKVMRQALLNAVMLRAKDGGLKLFETLELDAPKTKLALEVLSKCNHKKALVVIDGRNENLELAVRNLKDYKVIDARGLNVYDVLDYEGLYITKSAFEKVEAMVQ